MSVVDLIAQKLANNKKFLNKYHLELLVFIGSYGTNEYIPRESDMDIAFLSNSPLNESQTLNLLNEVSSLIKCSNLDLINLTFASGLLKYKVAAAGRLIYEKKQGLFERYKLYCYRYYYDTKKFRQMRREYFEKKMEELANGES